MPAPAVTRLAAAAALRQRLDEMAEALTAADLPRLLHCEAHLEAALTDIIGARPISADERPQLAAEIVAARAALLRCRRLGRALTDLAALALSAHGTDHGYGRPATGGPRVHTFRHSA